MLTGAMLMSYVWQLRQTGTKGSLNYIIPVGQTGVKLLPTHGIITPGFYYAFLERQLKDPDSPVIRKTVYKIEGRKANSEVNNEQGN